MRLEPPRCLPCQLWITFLLTACLPACWLGSRALVVWLITIAPELVREDPEGGTQQLENREGSLGGMILGLSLFLAVVFSIFRF